MRAIIILLLLVTDSFGAVSTRIGAGNFKTTTRTLARESAIFGNLTNNLSLTISCWVKYQWSDAGVNSQLGAGARQGLVGKGFFDTFYMQFGIRSNNEKLGFTFASPDGTFHEWNTTGNSVQTNSWMHVAVSFTYSNGNSLRLYINGTNSIGTWGTGSGNANAVTNVDSFHTFIYQRNGASSFFGGAMSELAIWTNTLSDGQLKQLFTSRVKYTPIQIAPESLLFFWPMDTKPHQPTTTAPTLDRDRTLTRFDLDSGGIFYGERALSYQPNE